MRFLSSLRLLPKSITNSVIQFVCQVTTPPPFRPECDMFTRPATQQSSNLSTITVKYLSEFQILLGFAASLCIVDVNQGQSWYLYTRSSVILLLYHVQHKN
jgi:hypothetical protein